MSSDARLLLNFNHHINTDLSVLYELDFDNAQTLPTATQGIFTPTENGIIALRSAWNGIQNIALVVDSISLIENNSANSFVSGNAIVNGGVTYTYTGQTCVFIPFK